MSSLPSFFPHARVRSGQDQLIQDLNTAFSAKKILLAHAPTGLGKTAAALSVAVQHALEKKKRIFFLTNRHTQHKIAIDTLRAMNEKLVMENKIVMEKKNQGDSESTKEPPKNTFPQIITSASLIGKRWLCSQDVQGLYANEFFEYCKTIVEKGECEFYSRARTINKGLQVEAKNVVGKLRQEGVVSTEQVTSMSTTAKMCSYEIALEVAKKALVIIGDYSYIFNPHVRNTLFSKMDLQLEEVILIVDEGHNLPSRIMDLLSSSLTTFMLKNGIQEAQKFRYKRVGGWLQEINRVFLEFAEVLPQERKEILVKKEDFIEKVHSYTQQDYDELINSLEIAAADIRERQKKSFLGGIAAFLEAWKEEEEGYVRIFGEKEGKFDRFFALTHSCLDPSTITKAIFERVAAGVLMSGTLKPTSRYKDLLGIGERAVEQEYSSPFPPENKLSLIIPETTTKYSLRGEAMYQKIAEKCSELASLIPGNVAFFFPSYEVCQSIGRYITTPKKILWEKNNLRKEEKEQFLTEFKAHNALGAVLLGVVGANFAEGIDLPGNFLNGVVIVGLPLARPDLYTNALIAFYNRQFGRGWEYGYVYPAMTKCIQGAGRCIRSETDKGAVIFLDERFAWEQYFNCFPREGLRVSKKYGGMIRDFFEDFK